MSNQENIAIPVVRFAVPGAPTAKGRPKFSARNGIARAYTPKTTRDYEALVSSFARAAMGPLNPTTCAVTLRLVAFVPIPSSWSKTKTANALAGLVLPTSRPDLDNYEKAVTDALNGICYEDDSQICDVQKSKRYSDSPRVSIEIWPIDGFNADPFYVPKTKGKA